MTRQPPSKSTTTPLPAALEAREGEADGRRFSPSAARNRDALAEVFLAHMPQNGSVLEVASGTGEHGAHIASLCRALTWWYSDIDPESLDSQRAWRRHLARTAALAGPIRLDVSDPDWTGQGAPERPDAIFCANMIHIAPFGACEGLIAGAGRHLGDGGRLMLYGPFARDGEMAPSNAAFSEELKRRNADWGVRDLDRQVAPLAEAAGFVLKDVIAMPANNLSVIWQKAR